MNHNRFNWTSFAVGAFAGSLLASAAFYFAAPSKANPMIIAVLCGSPVLVALVNLWRDRLQSADADRRRKEDQTEKDRKDNRHVYWAIEKIQLYLRNTRVLPFLRVDRDWWEMYSDPKQPYKLSGHYIHDALMRLESSGDIRINSMTEDRWEIENLKYQS